MATFFSNDFTSSRWKKAAQKNAFSLLGKQRFENAAAFFLLADKLWDAVEVCVNRLGDLQLAFVLIRLYEGDHGTIYQQFLKEHILGIPSSPKHLHRNKDEDGKRGAPLLEASPDPFLRSMAQWLLQDFSGSLETFLVSPEVGNNKSDGEDEGLQIFLTNPAIFNFYFFLRTHPVLLRRDHKTSFLTTSNSAAVSSSKPLYGKGSHLSSVGDEPLSVLECSLLFSTAYYHLCHGCPLLALNVFTRLPRSGDLGADICGERVRGTGSDDQAQSQFGSKLLVGGSVMSGMLDECGTLGQAGMTKKTVEATEVSVNDDFDWGAPVSSQKCSYLGAQLDDEDSLDWSKPFMSDSYGPREVSGVSVVEGEDEMDWSKPIFSTRIMEFSLDTPGLSPIAFSPTNHDTNSQGESGGKKGKQPPPSLLTSRGLFVLTLACQLQYNACLSILTEELHSIYIPACCRFLWEAKGQEGKGGQPATLPLVKKELGTEFKLVQQYSDNAFDRTLQSLRGTLVDWLKEEATAVRDVCHLGADSDQEEQQPMEDSVNIETADSVSAEPSGNLVTTSAPPSGYDLLTTLMNYSALHAATSPSLLTVKFELMHLVNTTLPWVTGSTHYYTPFASEIKDGPSSMMIPEAAVYQPDNVPTLAFSPSQLPILTSCSLPVRHLTNLATHLRLLSDCVIQALADHTYPPISTQPLPQVRRIFDLCCAISHCLTVSLNPVQLSDFSETALAAKTPMCTSPVLPTSRSARTDSMSSLRQTPTPSSNLIDQETKTTPIQARPFSSYYKTTPPSQSPFSTRQFDSLNSLESTISLPNTKPSKWPGMNSWPCTLTSDEGRDPTPMSLVMVECIMCVYIGLLATAWSQHSIEDLLVLLRNAPTVESWYSVVGGGVDGKRTERVAKNLFVQTFESVSKKLHLPKKTSLSSHEEEEVVSGVFVAPQRTLLDLFLTPPALDEQGKVGEEEMKVELPGFYVVGNGGEIEEEDEDEEGILCEREKY